MRSFFNYFLNLFEDEPEEEYVTIYTTATDSMPAPKPPQASYHWVVDDNILLADTLHQRLVLLFLSHDPIYESELYNRCGSRKHIFRFPIIDPCLKIVLEFDVCNESYGYGFLSIYDQSNTDGIVGKLLHMFTLKKILTTKDSDDPLFEAIMSARKRIEAKETAQKIAKAHQLINKIMEQSNPIL